ncbi:MAG: FAD-binding oxidoreductase [Bdellovibrio sp.]
MTVSYWMDRSKEKKLNADICIIGGGIAGLSTAYWLKKEDPSMKVVVVERFEVGDGATGRNAGFITCGSVEHFNRLVGKHGREEAAQIWKFSEDNLKLLKEHIIEDRANDLLFEHKGSFSLASTDSEFAELKNSAELMKSLDINVEVIEEQGIKSRLGVEGFVGGIKYVDDASVHPLKMLRRMREKIEALPTEVTILENNEVYAIDNMGDNKLIRTKYAQIEAPIVVFATNGYSPLLHKFFDDKIFPTRGQILATEPVPRFMEGPCYANFVLDYFRQMPTGEMIIGGFRQLQRDAEIGYADQTSDQIQKALEEFLQTHIPPVRKAKITHRWTGVMGFSVDGQPMVGAMPTEPQLFFVGGFTAHGLGLAFHSGKCLVDTLFDRPIPRFISARRFS